MGLRGTIAKEISKLSFLRSLIISNNSFEGFIPNEVGNLSQLQKMEMQYNNLNGSIPSSFGFLVNLQKLNLSHNILSGDIPNKILNVSSLIEIGLGSNSLSGSLPTDICTNLPKLKKLRISENQITGNIPPNLGICTNLELLSLSYNNFTGNIPMELWNLSKLQFLYLGSNNLIGSIPYEIGNMSALQGLYMNSLILTGTIPDSIGSLSNLGVLVVENNSLHGQIPQSIFNLSMLQKLSFTTNNISGNLPSPIANGLPDLEVLYFDGNQFSGAIPGWISNCSKLIMLDLSFNLFTGLVPINLGNLQEVEVLNLGDNLLTNNPSMLELDFLPSLTNCRHLKEIVIANNFFDGTLPKALGNFSTSLQKFGADYCGIKGMITSEIGNMSNLIWLGLGGNEFIGKIPDKLSQLMMLQMLALYHNNLHGSISDNLCNLVNLYRLDLDDNQLSQQLPTCLGNLSSLRKLYLANNSLTSTIPSTLWTNKEIQIMDLSYNFLNGSLDPEIGSMKAMRELYLSRNQFSGEIPITIGQLMNLENISISNNRLHGPIPESFDNLISLRELDLSNNNLYGVIPKSLEKLEDLVYFNVSFNELSGEIPNEGPFKNLTSEFFIGNREICGASQFKVKPCKYNRTRLSIENRVLKYILPSIAAVLCLAISVVYLIRCRSRNALLRAQTTFPITIKRYSYDEVLNATNKFGEENLIGKGSIGSVYKGIFSDGMIAAIKVFNLDLEGANMIFDTECQILCKIRHRNLIKVISSCSNLDLKALVLEYMPNGNLTKWLSSSNYFLNIAQRLEIMVDVACALEYLHHGYPSPIVHCDLKPSNILLDEDMVAHVANFGIAKLFTEDQRILMSKTLGTIGYMAPEYGLAGVISPMADVYSYGIVLMETFTKKKPTDDMFVGEFTMRRWVFESFSDTIMDIVDVDLVNAVDNNIRAKESCFKSVMGLALQCTADLSEERLLMKDVLTRLKKIKMESC
ncbi:probable LRR receptor-like serine threonine-kinase At3g47570 [Olea europaea subsp. europaea]|uniref:non-specific serine/threonine protein kinase n=1 Tax=Olea europaea subsp. europaea TaxID=158383 RepID=A0A8S0RW22_OLEEU|nr:probable LRR receptor-like serine threonine-kinase At3g47570 [Olea europaea subsp. europaea]